MEEIITNTERITLDETGVIRCKAFKNTLLNLDDAKENIQAVKILANGKKTPVLVDITLAKGALKDARDFFAGTEAGQIQSACALLVNSPLSQLVGNFFLGLNKTKFPTRLFKNEEKAIEWLKTFL
jgi:hypothetical protein